MSLNESEHQRLGRIAADSWYATGANGASVRYLAELFGRLFRGSSCLELGPAEGLMTSRLAEVFDDLTVVDGSATFCADLAHRFPRATVIHSLFEEMSLERTFDTIVLGHVLEHVSEPRPLLESVRDLLPEDGRLYAAVPNARSVHRQAAVNMGLLETEHTLNATDHHHGHRRVYDPESFRAEFTRAGFRVRQFGGYWLKPLSNAQIDETWSEETLRAFMEVGERYPDIAAEIYVIASR